MNFYAFGDVEPLRYAHVQIDEGWSAKRVTPKTVIDGVEGAVTIGILERSLRSLTAKMKSTLCPENSTYLKLPRQLYQTIELKSVIHRQIRWTFVQIGSIDERARLLDKPPIRPHE